MNTPSYIKSLLMPNGKKPTGKRVWSIDLEAVWLPFFTATNTQGDTAIPAEAMGAPIRLAYAGDGAIKFRGDGRPVTKVVKELADSVRLVRENFSANLLSYARSVATDNPDGYKATVAAAMTAAAPIIAHERLELDKAIKAQVEAVMREAEAKAEAPAPPVAEAEAPPVGEAEATSKSKSRKRELVTA